MTAMIADTAAYRGTTDSPGAYAKSPGGVLPGQVPPAMSRQASSSSGQMNGHGQQPQGPVLDIRVGSLEKGRKEITMRLRARTNIAQYRSSVYPSILRTYRETALLCLALTLQHQSTIVQALPIPFPSLVSAQHGPPSGRSQAENAAIQHQEDIFLSQLQRWFQRLVADPILLQAPELRAFIESEYSYHPTPPDPATASPALRKRFSAGVAALHSAGVSGSYGPVDIGSSALGLPSGAGTSSSSATTAAKNIASSLLSSIGAGSGSGSMGFATSRSLHDEDDELVGAREEVTRLEMQFAQAAENLERLSIQRRSQLGATGNLSSRMTNLAAIEEVRPPSAKLGLPHALGCTGEMLRRVTDLEEGQSRMEILTLGDMLAYQSLNARSAKEAMLSRNALVEELFYATKQVAARKQAAETLRGAANLRPDRVDEALQEYQESREREREIAIQLQGISQGLKGSLRRHSKFAHTDLEDAIVAHGRDSLRRARITLEVVRGLKPEIRRVPQQGQPQQRMPVQPNISNPPRDHQMPISNGPEMPEPVRSQPVSAQPSPSVRSNPPPSTQPAAPFASLPPPALPETPTAARVGEERPPAQSSTDSAPPSAAASPSRLPTGPPASMTQSMMHHPSPSPFASMSSPPQQQVSNPPTPSTGFSPNTPHQGPAAGMARSMFMERPPAQQQQQQQAGGQMPPNPFGNPNLGGSTINGGGFNSGRSRISARDAAKSLAGNF